MQVGITENKRPYSLHIGNYSVYIALCVGILKMLFQ